jgi:hypothetical protein
MFFGGFRLYNSWLHNNRTGIGMKMSDIKLPMMKANTSGIATDAVTNISASALYKYLGWTGSRRTGTNAVGGVLKNGTPLLMYLDIFKNFFANTQEDKFYMLKGAGEVIINFQKTYNNNDNGNYPVKKTDKTVHITPTTTVDTNVVTTLSYADYWNSIKIKVLSSDGALTDTTLAKLTSNPVTKTITLDKVAANPYAIILQIWTTNEINKFYKTELGQYDLKVLDQIRDVVLHKKGNETLILAGPELNESNNGSAELVNFFNEKR